MRKERTKRKRKKIQGLGIRESDFWKTWWVMGFFLGGEGVRNWEKIFVTKQKEIGRKGNTDEVKVE